MKLHKEQGDLLSKLADSNVSDAEKSKCLSRLAEIDAETAKEETESVTPSAASEKEPIELEVTPLVPVTPAKVSVPPAATSSSGRTGSSKR